MEVAVIAAYSLRYESRSSLEVWDMIKEVVKGVLNAVDKGMEPQDIDVVITSNYSDNFGGILNSGPLTAKYLGNNNAITFRVENACASGGTALFLAYNLIKKGLAKNILIVGFEKMSVAPSQGVANELLARTLHPQEIRVGATLASIYAIMAKAYMDRYGLKEEDMALVAVKNHENALRNPLAQLRRKISLKDVMESPYIAWPLKLLDCSPLTDGAAAFIISGEPRKYTDTPVYVKGIAMRYDEPGIFEREDITMMRSIKFAADEALSKVGIDVKKIDVFEVHDVYTIAEIIIYEMLGLAEKGHGVKLLHEGVVWFSGSHPVNPSGGLKAKGHPIGATGVGMVCELFWQLRQQAGERQVKDAELGLMENHSGSGVVSVVAVFGR